MLECVLFEDEHLLVVNKPAGLNTHSPSPYAGEGVYEWLKNREARWATLAIIHRLDKETSGVLVFGKSPLANRSLTEQFTAREVRKKYLLRTDREVRFTILTVRSSLVRSGDKYLSRPIHAGAEHAETEFRAIASIHKAGAGPSAASIQLVEAEPVTGRTHQIRVHAAERGFPILGDTLYGGTEAERVFLHAAEISIAHPATRQPVTFLAPPPFDAEPRSVLRQLTIDSTQTNAFRFIHGASDGWPGLYVERFGDFALAQCENDLNRDQFSRVGDLVQRHSLRGAFYKKTVRRIRGASVHDVSPQLVIGGASPEEIFMQENGVLYGLRFNEGYSVGIFLDQRENRRRLLVDYVAPGFFISGRNGEIGEWAESPLQKREVLNTFSYTCAFSVCAAKAGAHVTSLDLSKKYLEWGKRNFELNGLQPSEHDFIYGDTFDWLRRFSKKGRMFDLVLLDPPTFSQSKEHGMFRAEKDYGKLVSAALKVLRPDGVLFCSTNAADLHPERFLEMISAPVNAGGRKIIQQHFVPQPIDFPISKNEPAYLKTVWLRIA